MKKLILTSVALVAMASAISAKASPLTLNSPGVVGIYDTKLGSASPSDEIAAAQKLLDMAASSVDGYYSTSSTEYAGTLVFGEKIVSPDGSYDYSSLYSTAGYDWGFAKYDGQNAGYVLFYLGGAAASSIVPQFPADLWTTNPDKYAISHLTLYNKGTKVPDGGATVALLGLSLAVIGFVARRKSA